MQVKALAVLSIFFLGCSEKPEKLDVVLIAVDTLRRDHVGAYNPQSPAKTPNMDALAADGVRFTDAFSPVSVTGPAFVSMMTGQEPGQHGVLTNLFRGGKPLSDDVETVAERFEAAGYSTGAFVSAFTLRSALGLRRGFDVYNGGEQANRVGAVTASTLGSWLAVQEEHVFLWAHLFDAHGPLHRWLEPGELEVEWERNRTRLRHFPKYQRIDDITDARLYQRLYVRGVEYADKQVGVITNQLKQLGRYDDALIILMADHGEGFEERDLWYDHGTSSHAEQTQIPLLVKWPKSKQAGTTDTRLASIMDIAPTTLDVANLAALPKAIGKSLLKPGEGHSLLYAESSHCKRVRVLDCWPVGGSGKQLAVRDSTMALVSKSSQRGVQHQLFDRTKDAEELSVLQAPAPVGLFDALSVFQSDRRTREYGPLPNARPANADEEKLKQLGYLE